MRILLISAMYPSSPHPAYGVFVANMAEALRARGHVVDEAVLDDPASGRLTTPRKYLRLLRSARAACASQRPDVIHAQLIFPPGLLARLACRDVPYVITAHGADVANARRSALLSHMTSISLARAAAVSCVSRYLADRLPEAAGVPVEVIDCGVDTTVFTPAERPPGDGPRFLFVGHLNERKNVVRLLAAFEAVGRGTLTVIGSGPLEHELRAAAPAGVRFLGIVPPQRLAEEMRNADVLCQPSLVEPLGQALMEALATGRPVVATRVGGPPEYVTEQCGALVDPLDVESIAAGLRSAAALPVPCTAAVEVARRHDLALQAARVEAVLQRAVEAGRRPPR